jgi:hypothetical protein
MWGDRDDGTVKTRMLPTMLVAMAIARMSLTAAPVPLRDSSSKNVVSNATINAFGLRLADGMSQVVHLAQARINEDTIIAFVKNSGLSFGLTADQIIYLHQEGVSDAVINTMLSQPRRAAFVVPVTQRPAMDSSAAPTTVASTYVRTVPIATCNYQPFYYPAFAWYPSASLHLGWGGGWRPGWKSWQPWQGWQSWQPWRSWQGWNAWQGQSWRPSQTSKPTHYGLSQQSRKPSQSWKPSQAQQPWRNWQGWQGGAQINRAQRSGPSGGWPAGGHRR